MKFSAATFLALATAVYAQRNPTPNNDFATVTHPGMREKVQTGTTYTIKWTVGADFEDVLVNIQLIGGPSADGQTPRANITRGIANSGEYKWDIPLGLGGLPFNGIAVESAENPFFDYQYSTRFDLIEDPDYVPSSSVASIPPSTTASSRSAPSTITTQITITTTSTEPTSSAESSAAAPSTTAAEPSTSDSETPSESTPAAASSSTPPASGASQAKAGALALAGGFAVALFL